MSMMTRLYGLFDPWTGDLRYVGKTIGTLKARLNKHSYTAKKSSTHRACWFRSVVQRGRVPVIEELDHVRGDGCGEEVAMIGIARSLGCDLVNGTDGGDGTFGYRHTPEGIAKTGAASRGRPQSAEARAKRSAALKGRPRPADVKERIAAKQRGVPKSAETKARMSASAKKRWACR